jgi:hypothetical protein
MGMTDFFVTDHGTMWNVTAVSDAAKEKLEGHPSFIGDWRPVWHYCQELYDEGFTFETNTPSSKNLIETGNPW